MGQLILIIIKNLLKKIQMRSFALAIIAAVAYAETEAEANDQLYYHDQKVHGHYVGHAAPKHVEHRTYSEHHYAPYYYGGYGHGW